MSIFEDMTTLVTLAIAVFIFLRLRSVLGKRTGHQPPLERPDRPDLSGPEGAKRAGPDNIVTLPKRGAGTEAEARTISKAESVADGIAKPGTKLNASIRELLAADPSFQPGQFLDGAKMAYEMIVTAFADGDRKALKNLLSREVFEGFSQAISEREARGEKVQSSFVGIDAATIVGAELSRSDAQVTVRFVSQIISSTIDSAGKIIEGDAEQVVEVTDVWTFARDTKSRDPNWKLVATESGS
jgi:predicted lipid-binding transport protein (Tim44 family)